MPEDKKQAPKRRGEANGTSTNATSDTGQPRTLEEIAELTGFSKTTIWRVRNGQHVKEETRAAVEPLLKNLQQPGQRRSRRRTVVGVCIPDLEATHYGELASNIIEYATDLGFAAVIQATNDSRADETRAARMFRGLGAEAVILTSSRVKSRDFVKELENEGILVVAIVGIPADGDEQGVAQLGTSPVVIDHIEGTYQATKYLIGLGHRRIAFLAGPRNSSSSRAKHRGYRKALDEAGIDVSDHYLIKPDTLKFNFKTGYHACRQLMQSRQEAPTAIVSYNDDLALGALAYLNEEDIAVPGQVSVVGYDNIDFASFSKPTLTTVGIPRRELAEAAVDVVQTYLETRGSTIMESEIIIPTLELRASTGPPPPNK